MAILAKTKAGAYVFSMLEYRAYTDNEIFNKIESINIESKNYNEDNFETIIDELVKIYKANVVFNFAYLRNVKYISYIKSTDKFNKINERIVSKLSQKLGLELVDICGYENAKSDVRDAYIKDDNNSEMKLNNQYNDSPILIFDLFCSTGYLVDEIYKKYNFPFCYFLTIGIRFDCTKLRNTRIIEIEDTNEPKNREINKTYNQESVFFEHSDWVESKTKVVLIEEIVTVKGLFGKKNIKLSFYPNENDENKISIYVGDNGDGKSTSLRIAQLALDDNYDSYFKLSKYSFNQIRVRKKYKVINLADKSFECRNVNRVINYDDLIPKKEKIIESLRTSESNNDEQKRRYSMLNNCFEKFYLEEDYKVITDKNKINNFIKLLDVMTEDDYKRIFKKMRQTDNTYKKDLNRIASEIKELRKEINFNSFIEYFESFNNSIFMNFDDNYIETDYSTYINVTSNRNIRPTLSKESMDFIEIYDDPIDDYFSEDFYEDFEDSEEQETDEEEIKEEAYSRYLEEIDESDEDDPDLYLEIEREVENEFRLIKESEEELLKQHNEEVEEEKNIIVMHRDELLDYYGMRYEFLSSFFDNDFIKSDIFDLKFNLSYSDLKHDANEKEVNIGKQLTLRIRRFKEKLLYDNPFAFPTVNLENIIKYRRLGADTYSEFHGFFYDPELRYSNERTSDVEIEFLYKYLEKLKKKNNNINPKNKTSFVLELLLKNVINNNKYLIDYASLDIETLYEYLEMNDRIIDREELITKYIKSIDYINCFSCNRKLLRLEKTINKYLVDKKITFINDSLFILDMNKQFIPLNYLSAGEKNLILILSQCAFSDENRLIFDEPDLSMSIEWQENLIYDMKSLFSGELIIATQSPQLIRNSSLHKYVKSITDKEDGE